MEETPPGRWNGAGPTAFVRRVRACLLLASLEISCGVASRRFLLLAAFRALQAHSRIAQDFHDEQRAQRRDALLEAMAPKPANELFKSAQNRVAVVIPKPANQFRRRRFAVTERDQVRVERSQFSNGARLPDAAGISIGEQCQHPPRVMEPRRGKREDRAQSADGLFLRDAVCQAKQRRAFQPRAQVFRETARGAPSGCSRRRWPSSRSKTEICAHNINTFEVGRIYQKSEKIFWQASGRCLHGASLLRSSACFSKLKRHERRTLTLPRCSFFLRPHIRRAL